MWVKICGTTTAEDARAAVAAGADAVGFVFVPGSRRVVTPERVRAMGLGSEAAERVGVFATQDVEEIARAVEVAGLTGVQLHGGGAGVEALAAAVRARVPGLAVMPVVHWEVGEAWAGAAVAESLRRLRGAGLLRVLLDAKVGAALGGTGVSFDWRRAAEAIQEARDGLELVLAGGLRPETVGEGVRLLEPWGVDVVSGVEREAGRKDGERVRAFILAARAVETHPGPGQV